MGGRLKWQRMKMVSLVKMGIKTFWQRMQSCHISKCSVIDYSYVQENWGTLTAGAYESKTK